LVSIGLEKYSSLLFAGAKIIIFLILANLKVNFSYVIKSVSSYSMDMKVKKGRIFSNPHMIGLDGLIILLPGNSFFCYFEMKES
jgi:hypothetical protein